MCIERKRTQIKRNARHPWKALEARTFRLSSWWRLLWPIMVHDLRFLRLIYVLACCVVFVAPPKILGAGSKHVGNAFAAILFTCATDRKKYLEWPARRSQRRQGILQLGVDVERRKSNVQLSSTTKCDWKSYFLQRFAINKISQININISAYLKLILNNAT